MDAELERLIAEETDDDSLPSAVFKPPEELLDIEDPANDRFFRTLENRRGHVNALCSRMKSKHVQLARLRIQGLQNADIAKRLGYNPASISNIAARPDVQELTRHLRRVNALIEGPNLAVRKSMLWRIAANNEHNEPNVAMAAVRELNKIDGAYQEKLTQPTQVTVIINQDQLPKTNLDQPNDH